MGLEVLNNRLESSNTYQFLQRHKKVINIIQGFFIIGLLIAMNIYVINDHNIKEQIKENCGYTTDKYTCVCDKNFVDGWKELQNGEFNLSTTEIYNG